VSKEITKKMIVNSLLMIMEDCEYDRMCILWKDFLLKPQHFLEGKSPLEWICESWEGCVLYNGWLDKNDLEEVV